MIVCSVIDNSFVSDNSTVLANADSQREVFQVNAAFFSIPLANVP
jgi:hypothetical protein